MHVAGAQIVDESGNALILHGANLPPISEQEKAGENPVANIDALAAQGAAVVRLAVIESELTPFYVPQKLVPVVARANDAGVVLILSWRNDPTKKLSSQADDIEDFVRLLSPALRGVNGVWFDPIHQPLDQPPGKQRAVAERMINVLRGLADDRIVVINHASWLNGSDASINMPFAQTNVVYGVARVDELAPARLPLFVTAPETIAGAEAAATAGIGSVAPGADPLPVWRRSVRCGR